MNMGWHTRAQKSAVVDYWWGEQRAICCLCEDPDLPMDPYRRQHDTNPFAATLEHIIPKRDGGPDIVGNVRLAHKFCNGALGGLWSHNQKRIRDGREPLTIAHALAAAREKYAEQIRQRKALYLHGVFDEAEALSVRPSELAVALSQRQAPPGFVDHRLRSDRKPIKSSLAAAVSAGRALGLERGATLPGFVPREEGPAPRLAPRPRDLLERKGGEKVRRPICVECGSPNVTRDASLRWDLNVGWIIAEHRDGYECNACEASASVRWEFINHASA